MPESKTGMTKRFHPWNFGEDSTKPTRLSYADIQQGATAQDAIEKQVRSNARPQRVFDPAAVTHMELEQ